MHVKIYMGSNLIMSINAKRIDVSIDGVFIKITDKNGNTIETSPHNVIIIQEQKKGGSNNE